MFKIGPKLHIGHNNQKPCCQDGKCPTCSQPIESDKFEKKSVERPSLKTVVPVSLACGLVGAGAVVLASSVLNKVTKSKSGLVTLMAAAAGFGIANTVFMQSFVKGKSKDNA